MKILKNRDTVKKSEVSKEAEFKDRLEQALKNRDKRPAELARLTDINEGAISQYRKGAYKATQRNLEKISKVLGVSIPWLMGAEDEKEPAVPKDDELTHAIILGRNGKAIRRTYSPEDMEAVYRLLDALPHKDEDI